MRHRFLIALGLILSPLLTVGQRTWGPGTLHTTMLDGVQVEYYVPKEMTPRLLPDGMTILDSVPTAVYLASPVPPAAPLRIPPPAAAGEMRAPGESAQAASTFTILYIPNGGTDPWGQPCVEFPAEAKAALNAAARIWGTLVRSSVPITIKAGWASLTGSTLGYSGGGGLHRDFPGAPKAATWFAAPLANSLCGYDRLPDEFDMNITYNSNFSWYLGTDGNTPYGKYDLLSVVLHEIAHGLNFAGSMKVTSGTGSWGYGTAYPNVYDTFARDEGGTALINTGTYPNPSTTLTSCLTSQSVWFHGPYAMAANGGQRVKLYAPSSWKQGSSYSHLDYGTFSGTPNRLMVYAFSSASSIHDPGPVALGMLTDLGWIPPKSLTSFGFASPAATGVIHENAHTVSITVPYGTAVTALVPTITFTGASINPPNGVAQNFSNPVTYTVTATDASTQAYVVTVTVAPISGKTITGFVFKGLNPQAEGVINESTHAVAVTVPYGTAITALVPTITHTGASINPASGAARNFTSPVTYTVTAADASTQAYSATVTVAPNIGLSRSKINFGGRPGAKTAGQAVMISNVGPGTLNWTGTRSDAWITVSQSSGTGSGTVTIGVDTSGLAAGSYCGAVAFSDPNAANSPQAVAVNLTVYEAAGSQPPFGDFATPIDGTINVTGAIPVTGWALDDIGMEKVEIWRDPVLSAGEVNALYFIGNGLFVEGPRPDIETGYPNYPMNYAAGWGYMLLTNFLPNQGNGTYKLYAIATDKEGNQVTLGTKTITCDNARATKPFGTIDTPGQGGTATGNRYVNFGWVLTPLPGTVPKDGRLITVYVDSVLRGNLSTPPNLYNAYRPDVSTNFPGLNNTGGPGAGQGGPVGASYIDTTGFANGVHTIFWIAYDDLGRGDGIGSRYFSIANVAGAPEPEPAAQEAARGESSDLPISFSPVRVKTGFDLDAEFRPRHPDKDGLIRIEIPEVNRLEIDLGDGPDGAAFKPGRARYEGYLRVGDELRPLPVGSTLDRRAGRFSWMPGPAFVGTYNLTFIKDDGMGGMARIQVKITIAPK